jgi:CheY-like chemotaxis protein
MGVLGHDLRNPLSAMASGVQLLSRQLNDEGQQRTLQRMMTAARRMTGMIDQLLDLTRARMAGGMGFVRARQPLDVTQLVRQTIDELRGVNPGRQFGVRVTGDAFTTGDADRLLQVFSNLVGNAVTHGTAGAPITVSVSGEEREIVVAIQNQGAIPPEILPSIFDPFRGRGSRASGGLGLGLYIARQIAIAHGGNVTAQSSEAEGTTFTVIIPRRTVPVAPPPDRREPPEHDGSAQRAKAGGKARILVVEDDAEVREVLLDLLAHEGYQTMAAANGALALQSLAADPPPDLILLDLTMPVLGGAEFRERQLARPPLASIPVVVVSADPNGAEQAARLHASGFLGKPLNVDALLGLVERITSTQTG